jgi:hypothetical protein
MNKLPVWYSHLRELNSDGSFNPNGKPIVLNVSDFKVEQPQWQNNIGPGYPKWSISEIVYYPPGIGTPHRFVTEFPCQRLFVYPVYHGMKASPENTKSFCIMYQLPRVNRILTEDDQLVIDRIELLDNVVKNAFEIYLEQDNKVSLGRKLLPSNITTEELKFRSPVARCHTLDIAKPRIIKAKLASKKSGLGIVECTTPFFDVNNKLVNVMDLVNTKTSIDISPAIEFDRVFWGSELKDKSLCSVGSKVVECIVRPNTTSNIPNTTPVPTFPNKGA